MSKFPRTDLNKSQKVEIKEMLDFEMEADFCSSQNFVQKQKTTEYFANSKKELTFGRIFWW